jgi:hypothetical protein
MATATTAITDRQLEKLESGIRQLQSDAKSIRKRLDDDARSLEAALAERERIIDGIALGTAKDSEAPPIKAEIERLTLRMEGNDRLLKANQTEVNELGQEYGRRQGELVRAAREKEFAELVKQGESAANKLFDRLTEILTQDIPEFDAIRIRLGADFADLGGEAVATRLRESLWRASGPNEKLHDPNVYLWRLFDQGWVSAANFGPRFRSANGGYCAVPGGELMLTLLSLRRG